MQVVTADETHRLLDYPGLVEALRELFRRGVDQVERALISQPLPDGGRNDSICFSTAPMACRCFASMAPR